VKAGPGFESATPHPLFTTTGVFGDNVLSQYDVTRDGKKFLVVSPLEGGVSAVAVQLAEKRFVQVWRKYDRGPLACTAERTPAGFSDPHVVLSDLEKSVSARRLVSPWPDNL
jgi:hypothetical protein